MRQFYILFILLQFVFINCRNQENTLLNKNENQSILMDSLNTGYNKIGVDCLEFSSEMLELINILKSKQSEGHYSLMEGKSELDFKIFDEVNKFNFIYKVPNRNFKNIFIQSHNKEGVVYPYYFVTEICFIDEVEAKNKADSINTIINNSDSYNQNIEDFILQNGSRLIYVCSKVDSYDKEAVKSKDVIESIIKKNKP